MPHEVLATPSHSAAAALSQKLGSDPRSAAPADAKTQAVNASTTAVSAQSPAAATSTGILSHAAAFDSRLALLETSMGISSSSNPFVADGFSQSALQPVLPSLDQRTSRLSALTGSPRGQPGIRVPGAPGAVAGLTTPHSSKRSPHGSGS